VHGYYGCGYCRVKGIYIDDRVVFLGTDFPLRTDNDYSTFSENNQISISPLSSICNIKLFHEFPIDYMHAVCLGVTRKLFTYYFTCVKGERFSCRLSTTQMSQLSDLIWSYRTYVPSDFQRKPRKLDDLIHFKATEYRLFVIYLGPFFFRKFFKAEYYNHFCLLHFAMYVFSSKRHESLYAHAHRAVEVFVQQIEALFSKKSMVYNVHILVHLHDFVKMYGVLDRFSSFPFENYLSKLKKRIKVNNMIFDQSVNQLLSIRSMYANMSINPLIISTKQPDNCVMLENYEIIIVDAVNKSETSVEHFVSGNVLEFVRPLYDYPYSSQVLHIGNYKLTKKYVKFQKVFVKAICLPTVNSFFVIPYV